MTLTELADAYTAQLARMADGNSDGEVCGDFILVYRSGIKGGVIWSAYWGGYSKSDVSQSYIGLGVASWWISGGMVKLVNV